LQHAAELAQHGAQSIEFAERRKAARHGPRIFVDIDEAVESPTAPALRLSRSNACIAVISSAFAARSCEAAPITQSRIRLCPTSGATLSERFGSIALR
jgi:hypothetical protein